MRKYKFNDHCNLQLTHPFYSVTPFSENIQAVYKYASVSLSVYICLLTRFAEVYFAVTVPRCVLNSVFVLLISESTIY